MKFSFASLPALALATAFAEPTELNDDILSFTNGDSLHGTFVGIDGDEISWQRKGAAAAQFSLDEVRLVAFNQGHAEKPLKPGHVIHLITGDSIPGEVVGLDKDSLRVKTEFAGEFSVPREMVKNFERIPSGGELIFYGPFSDQDWDIVSSQIGPEDEPEPAWKFDSSAFYVQGVGFACPTELELPDDFELSFRLSTRDVSTLSVAFFADKEEFADEGVRKEIIETRNNYYGDNRNADLYGSALVLDMTGSRAQLSEAIPARPVPDPGPEEGEAEDAEKDKEVKVEPARNRRLGGSATFTSNSRSYDVDVQLRASKTLGLVQLLVDGKHAGSWKVEPKEMPEGSLLKFGQRRGRLRLSDIFVSRWNQMPDSALSMQSRERDVILMDSGTDRFSGQIVGFEGDKLKVETSFGSLSLENDNISKVVFAGNSRQSAEEIEDYEILLKMAMGARIGGKVESRDGEPIFVSRFGVEWPLTTGYLNFIEFDGYDPNLEKWYE